jgi:hypothetical protein
MAIPSFGFLKIEALACVLMVAAGVAGLLLVLTGSSDQILSAFGETGASVHVSSFWLVLQSLAVIAGGWGAWRSNSFIAAAIGVASSLVARTAVGHISLLPGLLMLLLIVFRVRTFGFFLPRWRGPGPPPPGAWRV